MTITIPDGTYVLKDKRKLLIHQTTAVLLDTGELVPRDQLFDLVKTIAKKEA